MRRLLRKGNRSSRHESETSDPGPAPAPAPAPEIATPTKKTTFFDLPAELRNDIYQRVAQSTILHLTDSPAVDLSNGTTLKKKSLIPGILLASRRCRNEYLPILLSTAEVRAVVVGYDFKFLSRVSGSLYRSELKALRENRQLKVDLRLRNASSKNYVQLRRWCVERANSLDRLPWRYRVEVTSSIEQMKWWCEQAKTLHERAEDETIKWEVRLILEALDAELERLGERRISEWRRGGDEGRPIHIVRTHARSVTRFRPDEHVNTYFV